MIAYIILVYPVELCKVTMAYSYAGIVLILADKMHENYRLNKGERQDNSEANASAKQ